jgi:hypothetical protein
MKRTEYAVEYLRPDGWWEAGRGWTDKAQAERDALEQIDKPADMIRVVPAPEHPREGDKE